MRIVIFGATGPTGLALLAQALEQGHTVTAVARNPAGLDVHHAQLVVRAGDVLDQVSVERAIANQDLVLWAVGGANAPAQRHQPSQVCTLGTQHILAAMQQHAVHRILSLSSWGVGDSMARVPVHFRYLIFPLILRAELADKAGQEALLRQSDRDWTIIRPSRLTNGSARGRYRSAEQLAFPWTGHLARADLAAFMLREVAERQFVRKVAEVSA